MEQEAWVRGSSWPWFCGPMILTKTKVVCFYSTMLGMLLCHSHSIRIAARDLALTLTFNQERRRGQRDRASNDCPFHQKGKVFSKAILPLSQDLHFYFLNKIILHGLQHKQGGCLFCFFRFCVRDGQEKWVWEWMSG